MIFFTMAHSRDSTDYIPIGSATFQHLSVENQDEGEIKIYGYITKRRKLLLYHLFCILLACIPYIIVEFVHSLKSIKYTKCPLRQATIILVVDSNSNCKFVNIKTDKTKLPYIGPVDLRYFFYQHTKYVWVPENDGFTTLDAIIEPVTVDSYLHNFKGLFDGDYLNLLKLYGQNKIEVEVKSYWKLFTEEIFNPFYLFQVFSIVLWCFDDYMLYAGCVVILTLFSVVTALIETRKQSEALHNLVESSKCHEVQVIRQNLLYEPNKQDIDPVELVPGDLIVLPGSNFIMPCDAVLLTGQCIVNESVLTGESVPVTKTSLHSSDEIYSTNLHKKHTLFAGTHIIQTRYYGGEHVLARVVRTGFSTTKGALVKSILFPTPVGLQFYKDSIKFVWLLFVIAATGMSYCLFLYIHRKTTMKEIIIRTLDIVTIVVPPALPAAMTLGTVYSQHRLKKLGIFCISPPRINVCGKIKLACFDKTGTLTHDGLDMHSVVACVNREFLKPVTEVCFLDLRSRFVQGMATCHSLTRIDGKLNGDPLDLNMFEFTKWELEEPGEDENARYDMLAPTVVMPGKPCAKQVLESENSELPYQVGIIRQFPFSSTLQCMTVICKELQTPYMTAFTKGAPEKLQGMCRSDSLPINYSHMLSQYTAKGYRVIAIAYKDLPTKFRWKESQKVKRDVIECELIFLGFLIMQNPLKDETAAVIKVLHNANIRTVMITGDNILTAVSVARDCGMVGTHDEILILNTDHSGSSDVRPTLMIEKVGSVDTNWDCTAINFDSNHFHFAFDGRTWEKLKVYYPDLIPNILCRTTIFARFQPDHKTQLVYHLQKLDYVVSMVGDGANDCGALKAAHVGVSLSQAEASVAAPFTSSIPNISCIVHLMLEGRCALVTSFVVFKYMAMYSLIQFFTILILYRNHSILGDFQFLFIDLVITTSLAVTIGRQGPSNKLGSKRPLGSLFSLKNLIPLILQIIACAAIQIAALHYLFLQEWFEPIPPNVEDEVVLSWENTVLFTVSCYQYVIVACTLSKGRPYRQMLITNFWFLLSALSLTVFTTWLMIYPCKKVAEIMDIMYLPHRAREQHNFRYMLMVFPVVHLVLSVFIEVGIGDRLWFKKLIKCLKWKRSPKNRYKSISRENNYQRWFRE